jgi:hypothetical protein
MERYIWTTHPYVAYTMVDKLFNPFTLLVGPCLVAYLMFKSTVPVDKGGYHLPWWNILGSYFVWLMATRTAKLLPHLWHRPQDVIYVPAFILFGYYFAIMKLYALCTLHETGWGTRAGIGDPTAATAAISNASNEKFRDSTGYQDVPTYQQQQPQHDPFADQQQLQSRHNPYRQNRYDERPGRLGNYQQPAVELQVGYAT